MYSTTKAGASVVVTLLNKQRLREISGLAQCNTRACAVLFPTVSTTVNLTEHFFKNTKILNFRILGFRVFDDVYLLYACI